jgi:hypothetical protein
LKWIRIFELGFGGWNVCEKKWEPLKMKNPFSFIPSPNFPFPRPLDASASVEPVAFNLSALKDASVLCQTDGLTGFPDFLLFNSTVQSSHPPIRLE